MFRPFALLACAASLALGMASALAAPAPAGETIANRASATWFNTRLGIRETTRSNTVEVTVLPVAALVVSGGQEVRIPRGGPGTHAYRIENPGNVALDVTTALRRATDDDFDTTGRLVLDENGDGIAGPGERDLLPGDTFALAPGEWRSILHVFEAPWSVSPGDVARSTLEANGTATAGDDPAPDSATGSATIVDAALAVEKTAAHRAQAGEIDYTLRVHNTAEGPVAPHPTATLDGAPVGAVVVRDRIPLNARFVSAQASGTFSIAYHRRGDPEHAYLGALPEETPGMDIDAVAFLHAGAYPVGRVGTLSLTVAIVDTVEAVDIENIAIAHGGDDGGDGPVDYPSNRVSTPVTGPGHRIGFRDTEDGADLSTTPFDTGFRVVIGAASCNGTHDIDAVAVTLRTTYAGDVETFVAYETGANTGRFLTDPLTILRTEAATPQNGTVEGSPGDATAAIATATCLGADLEAVLEVQPGGFVFDSVTDEPVEGAQVMAYAMGWAAPRASGDTPQPVEGALVSDSMTDADGYYDLGAIERGDYRIVVAPPERYGYPSRRRAFDGFDRRVDPAMSYGTTFSFDGGPVSGVDIPLDPSSAAPLGLFKSVDRPRVRRGGVALYTLSMRNDLAQAVLNAVVTDRPPGGFRLVPGSARLEGEALADAPVVDADGAITFALGMLPPGGSTELTYALRAGPAARQGKATNTAILTGVQPGSGRVLTSAAARASVRVDDRGGVFTDEAVVMGRVFLDRDGDGVQRGEEEPGVPGVRLVTAGGVSVVTDAFGRYSLFGLPPRTTAFALAADTLPSPALAADIDDAGAPGSRWIDLKRGEVRTESFALEWTPGAQIEVERRAREARPATGARTRLRDDLPLTFEASTVSERSSRSTARPEAAHTEAARTGTERSAEAETTRRATPGPAPMPATPSPAGLDPAPGFVGLADGDRVPARTIRVAVKSPAGSAPALSVNGAPVPDSAIGTRSVDAAAGVQVFEYVAIRLAAGDNVLALAVHDPFGNPRGGLSITVSAPGDPAGLAMAAPTAMVGDPAARMPVAIRVVDAAGRPVAVPVEVTLSAERGTWDAVDIRETKPGLQVLVSGGEAIFDVIPPALVGTETLRAVAEIGEASARIAITPNLGARVLVGVVEGALAFDERGTRAVETIGEDEISIFEETTEGIHGTLYLKGRIRGDALLTLRYDSAAGSDDRLFRDIRHDEFYPVYGDDSARGFDAQSASRLYVRVEKGTSYVLYGDIAVEARSDAVQLGAYRRALTGGHLHLEHGPVTADLFAARTDQRQRVIETDGRGVSGPYDIGFGGLVDGSEIVEILVRDRDQPDVILSTRSQRRLDDYVLDFFAGTLVFNGPVPRLDENLNPVSIRVTYETEADGGDDYIVYGGEVRARVVEGVALGYRDVRTTADAPSGERREVQSAFAEADLRGWGSASVELSATRGGAGERAYGARADYEYRGEDTILRIDGAVTQRGFDAPNARVGAGREELRARAEHRLDALTALSGDALYTRDTATGDRRIGAELRARRAVRDDIDVSIGARAVRTEGSTDSEVYSAIAGAAWRPRIVPGLALRAEYEQDVSDTANRRLLLGGDYQIAPALRLYALGEFDTSDSGRFGLGDGRDLGLTAKAGAEYRVGDHLSGYSEYRAAPLGQLGGGAAQGLRATWSPVVSLSLRAGVEHVEPLAEGDARESSASLGAVWDDREAGLLLRADGEVDRDEAGHGWFANVALAHAPTDGLTLLARNRLAIDRRGAGRLRDRLRVGGAWRPVVAHDRVQALGLYEFEIDEGAGTDALDERAHRWSVATVLRPAPRFARGLRATLKYAGERFAAKGRGVDHAGTLHLLRAGAEVDIVPRRLALGASAVAFTDDAGDTLVAGAGIELKAHVMRNVQIALGYDHIDVDRGRLRGLHRSGFHARLRLKLDDDAWALFDDLGMTGR